MRRIHTIIDRFLFYLLALMLGLLAVICFTQVIARYAFEASFPWVEEISILMLHWAVWVGAALAIERKAHLRVLLIEDRLPEAWRRTLHVVLNVAAIAFFVVLFFSGRIVVDAMGFQTLMSLPNVSIKIIYASVPCGAILVIYYLVRVTVGEIRSMRSAAAHEAGHVEKG